MIKLPVPPVKPSAIKRIAKIEAELARMRGILERPNTRPEFQARVKIEIESLELNLKTVQVEIDRAKQLAKGCATPSGKRIRV